MDEPETAGSMQMSIGASTEAPHDTVQIEANEPGYRRGVLLLKLKDEGPGAGIDPRDFVVPQGTPSKLPASLRALNDTHRPLSAAHLFAPGRPSPASVRARFPARSQRARATSSPQLDRLLRLTFDPQTDMERVARDYAADPAVEFAQPDRLVHVLLTPNDQFFTSSTLWGLYKVGAPAAWDVATGTGVTVAIIDTGIDTTHPDLAPNLWVNASEVPGNGVDDDNNGFIDDRYGWDFAYNDRDPSDGYGHGTHVAGTVAALANNTHGVAGLAFGARLMAVKGLTDNGYGLISNLAAAVIYAADNGADVINNSWGGAGRDPAIEAAINHAHALGVIIVSAAGNSQAEAYGFSPANSEKSLTVSALQADDAPASYSNFGVKVDVAAPGGRGGAASSLSASTDILSTVPRTSSLELSGYPILLDALGNKYMPLAGTSMASPHVAALAALLIQAHPTWTNEELRQAIRRSTVDVGTPGFDTRSGFGRISASAALGLGPVAPPTASLTSPQNGQSVRGTLSLQGSAATAPGLTGTYALQVGSGETPTSFTSFASGAVPVYDGTLGTLDSLSLPDGRTTLRLVTTDSTGRTSEDRNLVTVDNVFIESPVAGGILKGTSVTVTGMAGGSSGFVRYTLEWARGCNATSGFSTVASGTTPVNTIAPLGTWNIAAVPDGEATLRLTVTASSYVSQDQKCVVVDQLLAPGWPVALNHVPTFKSPKIVDLDGDGMSEIVLGASVFRHDGSLRPGWSNFPGNGRTNPAIFDADGDGRLEIVAAVFNGQSTSPNFGAPVIYAYRPDKSILWSTPVQNPATTLTNYNHGIPSSISAADVDGDGQLEVVFSIYFTYFNSTNQTHVFILSAATGTVERTFTVPGLAWSSIALADLDRNGAADLVLDTWVEASRTGAVHVLTAQGTPLPGWPRTVSDSQAWGFPNIDPVIGDVDRDGSPDILVGKNLWRSDGVMLSGWPLVYIARSTGALLDCPGGVVSGGGNSFVFTVHEPNGALRFFKSYGPENLYVFMVGENGAQGNPVVADIDGDGAIEIVRPPELGISDATIPLRLYASEASTSASPSGFPRYVSNPGDLIRSTAALGDVDGDGKTDMALAAGGQIYLWRLNQPYRVTRTPWPMFQHDPQNTGFVQACNGQGGTPCNTGIPGICAAGTLQCNCGELACIPNMSPRAEACNNLDDDCDGSVDEGNPGGGYTCNTGMPGICASGTAVCTGGAISCQQLTQPQAEACNGLDDNCNGLIDEGNPGGNVSCNTGQPGVCAAGTTVCTGGAIRCQQDTPPQAEACNGLDDDCNGSADEGNPDSGASCSTGQPGICAAGTMVCTGGALACSQSSQPRFEACNGLDDDCDGSADEGNPGGGVSCDTGQPGICAAGATVCTGGALLCDPSAQPTPELCNGLDDDCSGEVDEDIGCTSTCGGTAGGGTSGGGTLGGTGVNFANRVTSGVQECAAVGRECLAAYNDGGLISCWQVQGFNSGAAQCGAARGAGVHFANKVTSGVQECAAVGRECLEVYNDGVSYWCGQAQSFNAGTVLCGTTRGAGVSFTNRVTSGVQECAAVGKECLEVYNDGVSYWCGQAQSFNAGTVLCGTCTGTGVSFGSKVTSGVQECAAAGRECLAVYNGGVSYWCGQAQSFSTGTVLCGTTRGEGASFTNKVTSGVQECAALGRECLEVYNDGVSYWCGQAQSFNAGTVLCGTTRGVGASFSNKVTSGVQECAALGRECLEVYNDGVSYWCGQAQSFTAGAVLCGTTRGVGASFSNKVTSGVQECAAIGRECLEAYNDGVGFGCGQAQSFNSGAALCSL